MMRQQTRNELRCFCRRQPLLATYGLDERRKIYVHIKIYKNRRIYGEIIVEEGSKIKLRCRECLRWYTVIIRSSGAPQLVETSAPESFAGEAAPGHV